jgi:hypothetical protein
VQNTGNENAMMDIYNVTGQLVLSRNIGNEPMVTERIRLNPGIYVVRVTGGMESRTTKIIIQ